MYKNNIVAVVVYNQSTVEIGEKCYCSYKEIMSLSLHDSLFHMYKTIISFVLINLNENVCITMQTQYDLLHIFFLSQFYIFLIYSTESVCTTGNDINEYAHEKRIKNKEQWERNGDIVVIAGWVML